jgi:hypothetical protein
VTAPQQKAADLRTLVLRRVGEGQRVVLLAPDPALATGLEAAGCTVLKDPSSLEELQQFSPQVVVAFDGLIERGKGDETFLTLAAAAPRATLLFSFANCASASTLLSGLLGHPQPAGLSERDVRAWLAAAGMEVTSREVVVMPHASTGLSADTEAALRQLLEQLNPEAGVDRVLLAARRGKAVQPSKPQRVKGLTSLMVLGDGDGFSLDATLAAALAQTVRPLEVVCAMQREAPSAARLLERARDKDGLTVKVVLTGEVAPARMAQRAQAEASGQYLALVRAGDLADKGHLSRLQAALQKGTAAWAHALVLRGGVAPPPVNAALSRLATGLTAACGWMLDLDALGTFPVTFAEGVETWETLLYARLVALFPPVLLGPTGVERTQVAKEPVGDWSALEARPLRMLTGLDAQLELAKPPAEAPAGEVVARALGKTLEEKAPQLYGRLKSAARKIIE